MKAVLISIRPEWFVKIASGEKTIEVRKTYPKLETPFKCYIYCTKGGALIYCRPSQRFGNGKVIGEFVCDRIYPVTIEENGPFSEERGCGYNEWYTLAGERDALTDEQFDRYLDGKPGYGWHISDLKIYDEPKSLFYFCRPCDPLPGCDCEYCRYHGRSPTLQISRPPQSWCYVEELSG